MSFQQQFASEPVCIPNRKRKDMDEGLTDSAMNIAGRRKAALPTGRFGGNQPAMFHPLGAEDNLRMLQSLGLIPTQQQKATIHSHSHSHSASSTSEYSPKSAVSDMSSNDSYFADGHYPNIDPYPAQSAFAQGQNAMGMEVDATPAAFTHGPHCTGLPQLFVSTEEVNSALWAKCPSCSFSWKVENSTLDYRPWNYSP